MDFLMNNPVNGRKVFDIFQKFCDENGMDFNGLSPFAEFAAHAAYPAHCDYKNYVTYLMMGAGERFTLEASLRPEEKVIYRVDYTDLETLPALLAESLEIAKEAYKRKG